MGTQTVARVARLVDVVADKQHDVDIALRDFTMRDEGPLLVVLTRCQRDAQARYVGVRCWCRAGAPDGADGVAGPEPVEKWHAGRQARRLHVNTVRNFRTRHGHALAQAL